MFIKVVEEQLDKMSETEKDKWILTQAKLLEESMQQGFLMSLSNEKKIIYMPSQREIEEFCEKVGNGEIYVEYETHYYEFDDDGRYKDDWEVWHNDPLDSKRQIPQAPAGKTLSACLSDQRRDRIH